MKENCDYCGILITGERFTIPTTPGYDVPTYCSKECLDLGVEAIKASVEEMHSDAAYEEAIGQEYGF